MGWGETRSEGITVHRVLTITALVVGHNKDNSLCCGGPCLLLASELSVV